jgi:hypothetical protein
MDPIEIPADVRELLTDDLELWESEERQLQQMPEHFAREYETPIATVKARLAHVTDVATLYRGWREDVIPMELVRQVAGRPDGRTLKWGVIEDVAYLRRLREIVAARQERQGK